MGDGAKWIKSLPQYYKFESTTQVYYCLDKFHFKQAQRKRKSRRYITFYKIRKYSNYRGAIVKIAKFIIV